MEKLWHTLSLSEIEGELKTDFYAGLKEEEAKSRLDAFGPNKLPEKKTDTWLIIFLRQFKSPLIYILLGASILVFALREFADAFIILFVLIFNAVVGTLQEGKAQNTLLALKKFTETNAIVLRDGKETIIPDTNVAPGDILILREGEKVPADSRVIFSNNLKIDESSLTGESEPVFKICDTLKKKLGGKWIAAEQKNMVFKGTLVVSGSGKAVAIATGINTVIGKISKQIAGVDTEIPLKTNIRNLSRAIIVIVSVLVAVLFALGILKNKPIKDIFTTSVALSVSVIPEGLPIVLTLLLATGVWRMAKKNALVKKLQAVEALGQAKIIAVDKTGTITKNEMLAQKVYIDNKFFEITGAGYEPSGEFFLLGEDGQKQIVNPPDFQELLFAGKISAFSSSARVAFLKDSKQWKVIGDPTEASLLVLGQKIGFSKDKLESAHPLLSEIPFDYARKYHATLNFIDEEKKGFLAVVGAPENVLGLCEKVWRAGKHENFAKKDKDDAEAIFHKMSREGLRVLAMAVKEGIKTKDARPISVEDIDKMVFVGFVGIRDTLRPEAGGAVKYAQGAGMKVVMITGDFKLTAQTIAKEAGIFKEGDEILTGREIEDMSEKELALKLSKVSVFARVTPEHKFKIIQAYKQNGDIVAMTGDGVNDAPSLVAADLGVAMGKIGTEVAKEASDIILLDDNFGSIISAVEEGRAIYKTIKKVLLYLFTSSAGETLVIVGAILLDFPLPILAAQIIWLNLVTDGFLDVALAMEPKEQGLLNAKFKRPSKWLIDKLMVQRMALASVVIMGGTLFMFAKYLPVGAPGQAWPQADMIKAWTIVLTTLAAFHWFNAWNCRSEEKSIFQINPFSNKFLVAATGVIILLHIGALYTPFMQKILRVTPLGLYEWLIVIAVASSVLFVEEIRKLVYHRLAKQKS